MPSDYLIYLCGCLSMLTSKRRQSKQALIKEGVSQSRRQSKGQQSNGASVKKGISQRRRQSKQASVKVGVSQKGRQSKKASVKGASVKGASVNGRQPEAKKKTNFFFILLRFNQHNLGISNKKHLCLSLVAFIDYQQLYMTRPTLFCTTHSNDFITL